MKLLTNKTISKILFCIIIITHIGCSTIRFVGEPIKVDSSIDINYDVSSNEKKSWFLLDVKEDSIPGMSVLKAKNQLIKDKVGEKVIIGIIDSGVDINHPFLAPLIWSNEDEIPGNNIDDDKNGFVDDVNGWNFLGNSGKENMEYVRLLKKTSPSDSLYNIYIREMEKEIRNAELNINQAKDILDELYESDLSLIHI